MTARRQLSRDQRGASAVEMALAMPILVACIYGIFMIGLMFQANAGIQHALGEGARAATVYPTPTDDVLVTKMQNSVFGMNVGTFNTPTVTTPSAATCTNCRQLTVTYTVTPDFLLYTFPAITLSRSKVAYLAT